MLGEAYTNTYLYTCYHSILLQIEYEPYIWIVFEIFQCTHTDTLTHTQTIHNWWTGFSKPFTHLLFSYPSACVCMDAHCTCTYTLQTLSHKYKIK